MSRLSPFFVLVGLCRPYRAHMRRLLFQGFTPLAISCRPFGAQETVLLLQWQGVPECGTLKEWQESLECGRPPQVPNPKRRYRISFRSLCRLSPETFPFADNIRLPEKATEVIH